ncbi:HIRAN domain-containing protein [Arthrobacter sp. RAF14]|uniref:HIRAN domain-containing protein n=1 Tax=Arthrobacter sp. RAF14 TaxID=3233051 RepID=UPI003F913C2B
MKVGTSLIVVSLSDALEGWSEEKYRDDPRFLWTGVAGTQYFQRELLTLSAGNYSATLRPEFDNPHDSNAISAYIGDRKIGYVGRNFAYMIAPQIKCLDLQGIECTVIANVSYAAKDDPAVATICLPTTIGLDRYAPERRLVESVLHAWERLSLTLRAEIAKDGYHLTESTWRQVRSRRYLVKDYKLFENARAFDDDRIFNVAMQELRLAARARARSEREQRNRQIVKMAEAGDSSAGIARQFGLSVGTIRNIVQKARSENS